MATKVIDMGGNISGQAVQTGAFGPSDVVVINWLTPHETRSGLLMVAELSTDAELSLQYMGKRKRDTQNVSFQLGRQGPDSYSAVLTADRPVHDANVHLTLRRMK